MEEIENTEEIDDSSSQFPNEANKGLDQLTFDSRLHKEAANTHFNNTFGESTGTNNGGSFTPGPSGPKELNVESSDNRRESGCPCTKEPCVFKAKSASKNEGECNN